MKKIAILGCGQLGSIVADAIAAACCRIIPSVQR